MKIKINDKTFFFFNKFAVQQNLDSVASSFSFVARFNPNNPDHKVLFKPLSYPKIEVFKDDDTLLLSGNIINHDFNSLGSPELVKLSGYSFGGVLEDCNIPYSSYPLESLNRSLKDITEKLLQLFDLNLIIDVSVVNDVGLIYKKTVAQPTETIKSYLSKLAAQRNVVMTHDIHGNIIYYRPNNSTQPKLFFNKRNTIKMSFSVKGQGMYSEISVLRQPSKDNESLTPVDTAKNVLVTKFRPGVKTLSSGTDTDTSKAADNALALQLQNLQLNISLPRWEDLQPGDFVEVENDEIYLYKRTKFIIKSLTLNQDEKSETMSLTLVLPESYIGGQFKNIFE